MVLRNLFTGQQWKNRHREQTYGHGERKKRMRCMETVAWKLTLPYVKQIAYGTLLYGSGNSNKGSVSIQRGEMGGDGREVQKGGDMCTPMADSC